MNTASLARHLVTFLAGLGGMLASLRWIGAEHVAELNQAGADLAAPLTIIVGALAAAAARAALAGGAYLFRDKGQTGNKHRRFPAWLPPVALAGFFGFTLPACSPGSDVPQVRGSYTDKDGNTVTYSPDSGLGVTVGRRGTK